MKTHIFYQVIFTFIFITFSYAAYAKGVTENDIIAMKLSFIKNN
jgi:hypothetical protein